MSSLLAGSHLTEANLGQYLKLLFDEDIIHNRKVPGSETNCRPDFRIESLKLIIEFDGYMHYNNARTILADKAKDLEYLALGYQIIRIPYFIQLTAQIQQKLFGKVIEPSEFGQGFISELASLPADYIELGVAKFLKDLDKFSEVREEIIQSLRDYVEWWEDIDMVLPPSLKYLVE